jgi:Zn-dependent peptidase ImmA (M78 family)
LSIQAEQYAVKLHDDLQITQLPIDPFYIANRLRVQVDEISGGDDFDGVLYFINNKPYININKNISNQKRKLFTLAHELGHFSIPSHRRDKFECVSDFLNPFGNNPEIEAEANRFASELLLPERLLKPMLHTYKPDFESIGELSEDCGTSLTATAIKFATLTEDCCTLIASSENKIKWFQRSPSFPYWIEPGGLISSGTLTASYSLQGVPKESDTIEVHATYWFTGKGIDHSTTVFESCVPMFDYGVILTMIWFHDPPFDTSSYGDDDNEYRYEESPWRWRYPHD